MSKSAKSLFAFACYLFGVGTALVLVPNLLLELFGLAETAEVWVRVVGMLALILGYYYSVAAKNELVPIIRASVVGRASVIVFFATFVVLDLAPAPLIIFGAVDLAAAIWTALCLKAEHPA